MSKNMTRKGLAFGAGAALLSSAFVALPAQAAKPLDEVTLTPALGSEYTTLVGQYFDLETTISAEAANGTGNLKFKIVSPDENVYFDYDNDITETQTGFTDGDETDTGNLEITGAGTDSAKLKFFSATSGENLAAVGDSVTVASAAVATLDAELDETNLTLEVGADGGTGGNDNVLTIRDASDSALPSRNISKATITGLVSANAPANATMNHDAAVTIVDADNNGFAESISYTVDDQSLIAGAASTGQSAITAGSIVFTFDTGFTNVINGTYTVSETNTVNGSEYFVVEVDDNPGNDLYNGTFDLTSATLSSTNPLNDLDSFATIIDGDDEGKASVTGLVDPGSYDANDTIVLDTGVNATSDGTRALRLAPDSTTSTSVTVTAWVDENGDGEIQLDSEYSSTPRTINFVEFKDSGYEMVFDQPATGDDKLNAYLTFPETFNAESLKASSAGDPFEIGFAIIDSDGEYEEATGGSTVNETTGAFTSGETLVWDSSDNEDVWGVNVTVDVSASSVTPTGVVPAGFTFSAQLLEDLDGNSTHDMIDNESFKSTSSATTDVMYPPLAAELSTNVLKTGTDDYKVRTEYTGDIVVSTTLWEYDKSLADNYSGDSLAYGVKPVPAGTEVAVTVTESGSTLDHSPVDSVITANGNELETGDDPLEFTVTTNAAGVATVTISNSEGVAADKISIKFTESGVSDTVNLTWGDATPGNATFAVSNTEYSVEQEGTVTLTYTAHDEFGLPLSSPAYQVEVDDHTAVGDSSDDTVVELSNGTATLSFTDESESNGSYSIVATLEKLGTNASYSQYGSISNTTVVNVVTDASPAIVELNTPSADTSDGTEPALELVAAMAIDARYDTNVNLSQVPAYNSDEEYTVTGLVKNAAGVVLRGVPVTLSASQLAFNTGALNSSTEQLYTTDSITVMTSNTGSFTAEVRSNFAGDHTLTASAGTGSDSTTLGYDEALANEGVNLDVSIDPEQVRPQGTVRVTATLTDVFGNPVEVDGTFTYSDDAGDTQTPSFTVAYDGDGVAFGVTNSTDEDGVSQFDVLLGIDDIDANSVVVSYNADGIKTTTSDNYAVQAVQLTYGAMKAWTVDQGDGTAKVYVKFPTIGEKVRIGHQTGGSGSYETIFVKTLDSESDSALTVNAEGSYIVRTIDLVDGTNRIRVTVGDSTEVQVRYNE